MKYTTIIFMLLCFVGKAQNDCLTPPQSLLDSLNEVSTSYANAIIVPNDSLKLLFDRDMFINYPEVHVSYSHIVSGNAITVMGSYSYVANSIKCTLEADNSSMLHSINVHVLGDGMPINILYERDKKYSWNGWEYEVDFLPRLEVDTFEYIDYTLLPK